MMRRLFMSFAAFGLATAAYAAEDRAFSIGGEAFAASDIVDARALPAVDGSVSIMLTLSDGASKRLEMLTQNLLNKPLPIVLNGKIIMSPVVHEPLSGGVIDIIGSKNLQEATALAKTISGKDPLPESLEE
jgi:preprotein translocase subunit SecD